VFSQILDVIKRFLLPPLHARFVLTLLAIAATVVTLGFSGDWDLKLTGTLFGNQFELTYSNKSELIAAICVAGFLVLISVWLYLREGNIANPMSNRIRDLEDQFSERGPAESVCRFFQEIFKVYVSSDELEFIMSKPEKVLFSRHLKNSRAHVNFNNRYGFYLSKPHWPYSIFSKFFTVVYFLSAFSLIPLLMITTATAVTGTWSLFWQFLVGMFAIGVVAVSALKGYAACNSSLLLVSSIGRVSRD